VVVPWLMKAGVAVGGTDVAVAVGGTVVAVAVGGAEVAVGRTATVLLEPHPSATSARANAIARIGRAADRLSIPRSFRANQPWPA
jgi:hypothetical protein